MAEEPTDTPPPASPQGTPPQAPQPLPTEPERERSLGEMLFDVSERVTLLIREEFALAKAELTEKLTTLGRGAGVGIAAGSSCWRRCSCCCSPSPT